MNSNNLYQHFEKSEYPFIDKIQGMVNQVNDYYTFCLTDFLNPREVEIVKIICRSYGVQLFITSDYFDMEYSRVIIAPNYYQLNFEDFKISLLELTYSVKFKQISHRQILGTLINQLGIKRSMIGDILVSEGKSQFMIDQLFLDNVLFSIKKISNIGVKLREISFSNLMKVSKGYEEIAILSSSMRIDKIVSVVLNIPRIEVVKLLESNHIKLNYKVVSKVSEELQEGMLLSIKGFGRYKMIKDSGLTKKGKHKIIFAKVKHF